MTALWIVLGIALIVAIGLVARAMAGHRAAQTMQSSPNALVPAAWTAEAGSEFAGLSEAARCEVIFALSDLNDTRSGRVLIEALRDESETVALAAAHALVRRGSTEALEQHAARNPGVRADRIRDTLTLLDA